MEISPHNPTDRLDTAAERRLFIPVMLLGALALVFGFVRVSAALKKPFQADVTSLTTNTTNQQGSLTSLQTRDTDGDGLTDYDELYVYHTSPYLADSDSDGKSDKQEVDAGTDPNCAPTQVCTPIAQVANANTTTNNTLANAALPTNSTATNTASTGTLSPAELRTALKNAGAPAASVDALSDTELLSAYQEVLGTSATGTTTTNGNANSSNALPTNTTTNTANVNLANTSGASVQDLQNFTPAQIRAFLIEGGADAASVNAVDDATLQAIFLQSIQGS